MFDKGSFRIHFYGEKASGKTVALRKVQELLKQEGYEVRQDREGERGMNHILYVRWSKEG